MMLALLLAGSVSGGEVVVRLQGPAERCQIEIGDRWLDARSDNPELSQAIRTLPAKKPVRIVGDTSTPYRCIGGLIHRLQRLGHTLVPPAHGR